MSGPGDDECRRRWSRCCERSYALAANWPGESAVQTP